MNARLVCMCLKIISGSILVHTIAGKPNSLHDTEDGEEDSKYYNIVKSNSE